MSVYVCVCEREGGREIENGKTSLIVLANNGGLLLSVKECDCALRKNEVLSWRPGSISPTSYTRGGQLFSFAGHIGLLIVSRGPNSGQICFFKTKNEAFGRMLPHPVLYAAFTK